MLVKCTGCRKTGDIVVPDECKDVAASCEVARFEGVKFSLLLRSTASTRRITSALPPQSQPYMSVPHAR